MDLISKFFIVFFCAVLAGYYLVPKKIQWIFLLAVSLAFYARAGTAFLPFLCFSILSTYLAGSCWNAPEASAGKNGSFSLRQAATPRC